MKNVPNRAVGYALAAVGIVMLVLPIGTIILAVLPFTIALQIDTHGMLVLITLGIAGAASLTNGVWLIFGFK